jgi:hypothetical protein
LVLAQGEVLRGFGDSDFVGEFKVRVENVKCRKEFKKVACRRELKSVKCRKSLNNMQ